MEGGAKIQGHDRFAGPTGRIFFRDPNGAKLELDFPPDVKAPARS